TFEDVIAFISEQRMAELVLVLERMKVQLYAPSGDLVFQNSDDLPRDLIRTLKPLLEEETGIEWRIRPATEIVSAASVAERRAAERERARQKLREEPFVAEALKFFPEANVVKVTHPEEENGGGEVAPFPKKTETQTPAAARKQESER
ncbi:MAG TPA: hypothetical protein PKY87_12100, partial [Terricaulis sp.]|nr:hypothetical protein [Terricaulis sp.]